MLLLNAALLSECNALTKINPSNLSINSNQRNIKIL